MNLPLRIEEIQKVIPHRYPMLLVDRLIEFQDNERAVGIKAVSVNEPFFSGHFPGRAIMPGVLILEALAQVGVLFAKLCKDGVREDQLVVFAATDSVKWRRPVVPGDILRLEMSLIRRRSGIWKMQGTALVDGDVAMDGVLTAAESAE